jgi:hypothetical protein
VAGRFKAVAVDSLVTQELRAMAEAIRMQAPVLARRAVLVSWQRQAALQQTAARARQAERWRPAAERARRLEQ